MLGTYAALILTAGASAALGQAVFIACGRREWSHLAPAVGLGLLCALAWGAVRLAGDEEVAAAAVFVVSLGAALYSLGRGTGRAQALRIAGPVALAGLVLCSLPFIVEGRFGILGTGLNPDMSQHLFAAHGLEAEESERLLDSGYPLGPHALVVVVSALGPSLVQGFDALTLAVALAAVVAPLALLADARPVPRVAGALVVGLPYMVASYLVQGSFKETMEALLLLAFAIGMLELGRGTLVGEGRERLPTGAIPLAALAVGAIYAYSFPGLLWLGGAMVVWALLQRPGGLGAAALGALVAVALAAAPEIPRMVDFASFETFDPSGPGLGNLFDPISPLEALGIWPSGDFRLDPGEGAIPGLAFYLGAALAAAAVVAGLLWWLLRRELAVPAALAAALALFVYALAAGTPYQEAKAIAIASPLVLLIAIPPLVLEPLRRGLREVLALAFILAALGSSVLALANGPVGPSDYSTALAELRRDLGRQSTLVLAPHALLAEEHGRDYLVWELRGGRICVEEAGSVPEAPRGTSNVITVGEGRPFAGIERVRTVGGYTLWAARPAPSEPGPCPLISPGARADPASE